VSKHASLIDPASLVPRRSHPLGAPTLAPAPPPDSQDFPASQGYGDPPTTGSRIPAGRAKPGCAEPLTLSIPGHLIRKGRVLAAVRGTTISRLVTHLLEEAIQQDLPALLADLQGEEGGDQ
jgi:hypothetical protein